ncbi:MAG: FIST signal transduction protein [Thermodesulfobacteriota bacterium]
MKKWLVIISLLSGFFLYSTDVLQAQNINTGYGWSVNNNEKHAVKEAVMMMHRSVQKPELVIAYCTVGYDVKSIQRNLREELGESASIFGLTSCWGVISTDGIHVGEKGSLAILGLSSSISDFGVSGRKTNNAKELENKAAEALKEAISKAGKPENSQPDIVIMASSAGIEEAVLEEIKDIVGSNVPVYGGTAADNTISGNWKVFNNDEVYSSGFSLVAVFTELKVGHAFHSGYLGSEKSGIATKVKNTEGRMLLEIDGSPAAEIYNEWAYNRFGKQLKEGGSILRPASFCPIAKSVTVDGSAHYIGVHPSGIKPQDKSLQLFANVKEGTRLYFTEGTPDSLIYRPKTISRRALVHGRIKKGDISSALFVYCAGTMLAVQDRITEIVPLINDVIGNVPYIGAFTFGEQGNIKGYGNFHGNLMSSMVAIGS